MIVPLIIVPSYPTIFFFFNDTATTEIYTLSLHDPLPILTAGDHTVRLVGPAGNCTIAGDNPRALHVTTGGVTRDTARTTFEVTCVAVTGTIQVTAATSGIDLDPDGYNVLLDNGQQRPLGVKATAV